MSLGVMELQPERLGSVTQERLAWSLEDISKNTGLSMGFLRNDVLAERLPIKKFGRRVLVLDADLKKYLENGSQGTPQKKKTV